MPFPDLRIPRRLCCQPTHTGPPIKRCPLVLAQIHDTLVSAAAAAATGSPSAISGYIAAQLAAMQRNSYHFIAVDALGRSALLPSAIFGGLMYLPERALDEQMAILLHNTRISLGLQFENMGAVVMMAEDACESVREQMARARKMGVWLRMMEREGEGWREVHAGGKETNKKQKKKQKRRKNKGEGNQTSASWCAGWLDGIRVRGQQDEEGWKKEEGIARGAQTRNEGLVLFPPFSPVDEKDESGAEARESGAGREKSEKEDSEDDELDKGKPTMKDSSSQTSRNSTRTAQEDVAALTARREVAQALVSLGEHLVERHEQHRIAGAEADLEIVLGDVESAELNHLGEFLARLRRSQMTDGYDMSMANMEDCFGPMARCKREQVRGGVKSR